MSDDRRVLTGTGVGRGAAVAPAYVYAPAPEVPSSEPAVDAVEALATVTAVLERLASTYRARGETAEEPLASVLTATAAMAVDPVVLADVESRIRAGEGPVRSVHGAFTAVAETFASLGGYMAERATDLLGIRDEAMSILLGRTPTPPPDSPHIVVADDLAVAQTSQMDVSLVAGIVLEHGGPTGHTAIIAKQMGIPCVVGVAGAQTIDTGQIVAVEALTGTVTIEPDATVTDRVAALHELESALDADTQAGATACGHRIALLANIGAAADADAQDGAPEGVGLFRTEVLYLDRPALPGFDEQVAEYTAALSAFPPGSKVVIRTIDAGADKPVPGLTPDDEPNPALGVRGHRLARIADDVTRLQLEALAAAQQAASGADLWVMAPMIATPAEAREFAERARDAGLTTVGVMVEVPAAALLADAILREVDFVSIGTNDLAQYTMAADRLSPSLSELLDPWQPAVLRLIEATAQAGVRAGKPVGVCGESAADPLMALVLVGLGVTSLSMATPSLPAVRYALRHHTLAQCEAIARLACGASSAAEGRAAVRDALSPSVKAVIAP